MTLYVIKKPELQQPKPTEQPKEPEVKPEATATLNKDTLNNPGDKKVVIDGPLSTIYTNALNAVYANEASASIVSTMIEFSEDSPDMMKDLGLDFPEKRHLYVDANNQISSPNDRDLYIYATTGDEMDDDEAKRAFKSLQRANENYNVTLAMETSGRLSSSANRLMTMATQSGINTTCIRRKVMEAASLTLG